MKKLSLTLLVVACVSFVYAQQAKVKIRFIGATDHKVNVLLPINNSTFYPNVAVKSFDKDSSLTFTFETNQIATISINNSKKGFKLFIEPGQVNITFDITKKGLSGLNYQGANKEGQLPLNNVDGSFYQSRADKYQKLDSTAKGLTALINTDRDKELAPFQKLLAAHKISQLYFDRVKSQVSYTYAAIAALIPKRLFLASKRPGAKTVFKKEFQDMWEDVYKKYPINDMKGLNSPDFYDYANYYADNYLGLFLPGLKGIDLMSNKFDDNEMLKRSYGLLKSSATGEVREFLLASFLNNELAQRAYQSELVVLYDEFKRSFPQSKYTPLLKPAVDQVIAYHQTIKSNFATDQKLIIDYSKINSLDELAAKFKGKTVFVDIWATWCGPCKVEFDYKEDLDKFLKSKGVDILYISMDKDEADQQWKDMIKYYGLSGNHIRTNKVLQQDLMNIFWDGKGYSIPRYVIVKDGKVVVANALKPSDKNKLYEQISQYL